MSQGQTAESDFDGTWLVSEYVYSPAGDFSGVVRQRRRVEPLDNGRVRVTQECAPEVELRGGPMEAFAGRHVFELALDGRARRYLGPAVIGTGLGWGDGAMTGRGVWPEFGHNFTSFAAVPEADLQLTGGAFFNGTEMVANIAGVAVPETSGDTPWPSLEGPEFANEVAGSWEGTLRSFSGAGEAQEEVPLVRRYSRGEGEVGFAESSHGEGLLRLDISPEGERLRFDGAAGELPLHGLGKRYGWLLSYELCLPEGGCVECTELLDAARGRLVVMRRWWVDGLVDRVDWITFSPEERDDD